MNAPKTIIGADFLAQKMLFVAMLNKSLDGDKKIS